MKYVWIATIKTDGEGDDIIDVCSSSELAKKSCEDFYDHHEIVWQETSNNDFCGKIIIRGIESKATFYYVEKWSITMPPINPKPIAPDDPPGYYETRGI